jgi:hypothetical protein
MDEDLKSTRAHWERGPGERILSYHAFPKLGFSLTILAMGGGTYKMIRYFQIGGRWQASVDLYGVAIDRVWDKMAELTGGEKAD